MPTIKRYPNRKLYDTEAKQYITLDAIAKLIRLGQDVQVIDHASGEDLTALTLTQIIFEQEKKNSGFLPRPVLTGLIQAGGETMGALRRTLATPLEYFRTVDEEINRRVRSLVKRGDLTEEEGGSLLSKLLNQGKEALTPSPENVEQLLHDRGVPTHKDIDALARQIDELTAKLETLESDVGAEK